MKIQLEQTSSHCPERISCVACRQLFQVGTIRQLLIDNRSLVQGDLCPNCARHSPTDIQRLLRASGLERMLSDQAVDRERGQELLVVARESLELPSWWQWLLKKISVLATETQALEQARFQITPGMMNCRRIQSWEALYQEGETR
jgi:hypothetical protein